MAVLVSGAIGLAGCGESAEEKAAASVCSSTKAIRAQISKLSDLSVSSKAPEEIKDAAAVMKEEATKIKESTPNLPAASKAPVESAQKTLRTELAGLATTLVSAGQTTANLEAVLTESEHAVAVLGMTYKQAYESLKCS
jgi:hypothetical protein